MPWNRCGIPRNAMVDAEREIDPKKTDCKWMYTSLHKGRQEIVVWDDGQPVNFLSDYYTSKHTGTLKRSTKGAKAVYFVQVPSAPWAFNVFGRSGCDSADQFRKNMATADRKVLREGVKGMLFLFDICFSNGLTMKKTQSEHHSMSRRMKYTKHTFLTEYCDYCFLTFTLRANVGPGMPQRNVWCHLNSGMALAYTAAENNKSHTLIDAQWEKQLSSRAMHQGSNAANKKVQDRGQCVVCKKRKQDDGDEYDSRPLYTKFRCLQCPGNKADQYYHADCFFKVKEHTCLLQHAPPPPAPPAAHQTRR